jgi:hypothetical protein
MKHILSRISLVLALFSTSCSDFLDERPTGTLSSTSNLSSADAAVAFANGAYVNATVFNSLTAGWGSVTPLLLEYMTGKASSENSQSNFKEFQELTVSSRSPYIEEWWRGCYAGIANCNLAMQKLPEFTQVDPNLISRYQGEVLFMRAMYYFYLVRIFGDVPKINTSQTEITELFATRSPIKEIYDEIIIPDLLAAEKLALPVKDLTGRVSMSAVKALLADVYLTYAGYPVKGGNQYYAESAKRSLEVLKQYTLFGNYEDLWNPANNNKGEFIFQVQFSLNKSTNQMVNIPLPSRSGMSAFNLEYGSLIPTKEFVESYREGDLRSEEKKFFFSTYKGNKSKFSPGAPELEFMDFKGYYIHKFFDASAIDVAGQSGLNWTIYRLPDVMLMYAEAQSQADGSPNAASFDALNAVRKRAGLAPFASSDPAAFTTAVWDERYFELCYENKMWFDMIRTRKIRNDLTGRYVDFTGYTTKWGKTYTDTQLLFPIPLREMQTNPKLIQNSGY